MLDKIKSLFVKKNLGLLPLEPDARDYDIEMLGWGKYAPKHSRFEIKTLSVKNQYRNTCTWNSRTAGKEIDEGEVLSVDFLVKLGRRLGYIRGDGFANLRASEKVVQKYGICKEELCTVSRNGWVNYSRNNLSSEALIDADKHKSQTFWRIKNRHQAYKALDEGRTIRIGIVWKSSMNNGVSDPYILDFDAGYKIGAHAILVIGYDLDYNGEEVFICQNSFGKSYGDGGKFYIRIPDFVREIQKYGAFTDLDMPKSVVVWLKEFNGKAVKDSLNPDEDKRSDVYLIKDGMKYRFDKEITLHSHGFLDEDVAEDESGQLADIQSGGELSFWSGENARVFKVFATKYKHLKGQLEEEFNKLTK